MGLPLVELEELDLSHNQLVGGIWKLIEPLCATSPAGMSLQHLRLNHNKLSGELPPCLMQLQEFAAPGSEQQLLLGSHSRSPGTRAGGVGSS